MPKVGKKEFPYTKKGKEMAKEHTKKTGMPMMDEKDMKKKMKGKK